MRGFPENIMAPPTMTGRLRIATGERGVARTRYCTTALVIGSISCKEGSTTKSSSKFVVTYIALKFKQLLVKSK